MSTGYQINDQEGLYYLTFQVAGVGWFALENSVIGSRRLQFRSGEVKKTSPSGASPIDGKAKKIKTVLIIILIIGLAYQVIDYISTHSYEFIERKDLKLERILNQNVIDSVDLTFAVGNKNDTLVQVRLRHYCLLIWNISNYQDILNNRITYDFNNRNRDFYFTPYSNQEISPALTLKYKLPDHISKDISLNLSIDSDVYDSIEFKQEKGYCLRTPKFGIGNDKNRSHIIFDFNKEKREVIFMFYKRERTNYLLVFYSISDEKIDSDILFSMIH